MASIHRFTIKSGPRWAAHWRDATGKQHRKVFPRRKDADAWLTTVEEGGSGRDVDEAGTEAHVGSFPAVA